MPSPHYDPVPLHSGDIADSSPYDPYAAPSGSPSPYRPSSPAGNMSDFEPPRPGFMGPAGSEGPSIRDSIASSQYADGSNRGSEYNNSLYALNQDTYSTGPALTSTYTTYRDDPNAPTSELGATAGATAAAGGAAAPAILSEKQAIYGRPKNRRRLFIIGGAVAAVLLILAVVLPVIFTVVKKDNKKNGGQSGSSSDHSSSAHASSTGTASSGKPVANVAITGGDGSEVTMEDGSKFTYKNSFGGYWYHDPEDPFNNAAKVNSWTPALNQTFVFGKDRIYGWVFFVLPASVARCQEDN
jgi:glucan 1,3-beta-glucosidase